MNRNDFPIQREAVPLVISVYIVIKSSLYQIVVVYLRDERMYKTFLWIITSCSNNNRKKFVFDDLARSAYENIISKLL